MSHPRRESIRGLRSIAASMLMTLVIALITGFLLLLNGAIVLVSLKTILRGGPDWTQSTGVWQFLLFTIPVVLVILQWMAWDAFCRVVFRPKNTPSPTTSNPERDHPLRTS